MRKKPLEIICYVCGAGAFGVFFRWLQDQLAFDEAGLNERSVFNLLVPVMIVASALVFQNFVRQFKDRRYYPPEDFCDALFNPGKLFTILRWMAGVIMILGAALLLMTSEADPQAEMIRVLCLLAALSGLVFPLVLGQANYEYLAHERLVRLGMMLPVLMYALWLILCYMQNAYNSVAWSYAVEVAAIIFALLGFFRVAGFAFHAADGHKALFAAMFGTAMCIMALADERYMGMHLIFLASAMQLALYVWVIVRNLEKKRPEGDKSNDREVDAGGFEKVR
ncbi:MAG: hypothetical protein IJV41_00550 [Oscillospiraceae bacterium]|nr:hypothetical protein [Oscillospiraceae bacterium]